MGSEKISTAELNRVRNGSRQAKGQYNLVVTCLALVLLVAFTFLLTDYFKQGRVQANLRSRIETQNAELAVSASVPADLAQQLEQTEQEHQAMLAVLSPDSVSSTEIIAALIDTAAACNLNSANLRTSGWSEKSVGERTCRLMPVDLDLEGSQAGLQAFIEKAEDISVFPSLVIDKITISAVTSGEEPGARVPDRVTAHLTAMLVTRIDAADGGN